jgi:hypothetical protein
MGEELSNARTVRSLLLIPWLRYVRLKNGLAGPMTTARVHRLGDYARNRSARKQKF